MTKRSIRLGAGSAHEGDDLDAAALLAEKGKLDYIVFDCTSEKAISLALIRRSPDRWWIPGSAALVALAAAFTWLAPVVLAPAFNDFEKLPPGHVLVAERGEPGDVRLLVKAVRQLLALALRLVLGDPRLDRFDGVGIVGEDGAFERVL